MKASHVILLLPFLTLIPGCASYKLGANHDPGFKTIYIENFKSEVDEPALETLVTTTVSQQFQRDGTVTITTSDSANVILKGRITSFETTPVRYSRANEITPTQATMTIGVHYTLTRQGKKKPYHEGVVSGSTSFFIGNDLQSDKRQGVPLAAAKLGQSLVSSLLEAW